MKRKHTYHVRHTAWLWWTALLIMVIGGGITYLLSLQKMTPFAQSHTSMALMITVIGSGLCVILATADWWLKR